VGERRSSRRCCRSALNGAVAYAVPHLWNHLHDYQKRRIETFLNPGADPYGAGYQIIQSEDRDRLGRRRRQGLSARARRRDSRSCRCAHPTSSTRWSERSSGSGRFDRGATVRGDRVARVRVSPPARATDSRA
jgi:hypothetical protein